MNKFINSINISKFIFNFFLLFLFLHYLSFAADESNIKITNTVVNKFITVSVIHTPEKLIPNYEYKYPIVVALSLSSDSLRNINSNNVTVYVKAIIETESGDVYFKDGQNRLNTSYLTLYCNIENRNAEYVCSGNSILSKELNAYMFSNSSQKNISAQINFYASTTPFDDFIPILQQSVSLRNELSQLVSNLNTTDPNIQEEINETEEALSSFHIEEAKSKIDNLKMQSGNSFMFSLSYFINQIIGYIQSLFDFVSPDFAYIVALFFSLILIVLILLFKVRKNEKIALITISIVTAILALLKMLPILFVFLIQFLVLLLVISIAYTRNHSKRKFRSSDDYVGLEYDEILKRRK